MTALRDEAIWTDVCGVEEIEVERGVAALLDGVQVALFRTYDGAVFAVGNRDPFSGANVIARGIVGSRGSSATVASPIFKQVFDLQTGQCLDDPSVHLPVFAVRVKDGRVEVHR
jgi:nitrite reductase (NADH) small subunit